MVTIGNAGGLDILNVGDTVLVFKGVCVCVTIGKTVYVRPGYLGIAHSMFPRHDAIITNVQFFDNPVRVSGAFGFKPDYRVME
jgi:hypothetical protein